MHVFEGGGTLRGLLRRVAYLFGARHSFVVWGLAWGLIDVLISEPTRGTVIVSLTSWPCRGRHCARGPNRSTELWVDMRERRLVESRCAPVMIAFRNPGSMRRVVSQCEDMIGGCCLVHGLFMCLRV